MDNKKKRKLKVKTKKLANSFKYAIQGILTSIRKERNMKIHFFIMIAVIILGFVLKISKIEWIICIILFGIIIAGEMFNTAIETTVDIAMPYKDRKAKIAKDVSAGGVLILAIISIIIGCIIFLPKIVNMLQFYVK